MATDNWHPLLSSAVASVSQKLSPLSVVESLDPALQGHFIAGKAAIESVEWTAKLKDVAKTQTLKVLCIYFGCDIMKGKINLQKAYSSSNKSKTLSGLLSLLLDLLVTAIEDNNLGGVIYGDGDDKEQDYVLIAVYYACLIVSKGKPQLFQGDVVEFLEKISL